jgi:hypothetical protein
MSGINPPPKPPSMAARPTVPLKPTPAPANRVAEPPSAQAAAPKKETARITLPPEGKTGLPKATIKMQQTQPLVSKPAPMASTSGFSPAVVTTSSPVSEPASDSAVTLLSILVLVTSLASLGLVYLAYSASSAS